MLAGGPSARAFGLCGGISIEVAQTNLYGKPAPASRADITRSIRIPMNHSLAKKRGARGGPSWDLLPNTPVPFS